MSEEDVSFELLNILINVRPGRWWRGIFFPRRELVRKGWGTFGKGGSFVTSELVNMLSHFSPVRWWRGGGFFGKGIRSERRGKFNTLQIVFNID